jgi:mono/diheme cytochrome c family protein
LPPEATLAAGSNGKASIGEPRDAQRPDLMNITSACLVLCLALGAGFTPSAHSAVAAPDLSRAVSPLTGRGDGVARPRNLRFAQGVPVANGAYTASQAERGKVVYEQSCSTCHGSSLRGGANDFAAPALSGPFFYEKWNGRPLEEFFRYAADNMPPDQTKLSEAAYLDVTAYVLQVWKHPAGNTDLAAGSPAMKRSIEGPR